MAATSPPRLLTLILISGLSVGSLNLFLPSLPQIAADFKADYGLVNLSIAGFAAATAILQLIMGPLSDRYGRRPVILVGIAIFIAASIGCALAPNVWAFLGFRMVQAVIASGYAVSLAVIRDTRPPEEAASVMGYLASAWAIAPMLGPVLGGLMDEWFGWRSNFWLFAGLGVAAFALVWADLGETNRHRTADLTSQFRAYPELFRSRRFWGYTLCAASSIGGFYVFLGGAPLVAAGNFPLSTAALGVAMGTITVGFIVGSFLVGRYGRRFPLTTTITAGRIVAAVGLAGGLVIVSAGIVGPITFFGACMFLGLGNGLTMPGSNSGALSVRPKLAGSAAGLSASVTVAGAALVSAFAGAVTTKENAAYAVLAIMLSSVLFGLAAALYVRWVDRREAQ